MDKAKNLKLSIAAVAPLECLVSAHHCTHKSVLIEEECEPGKAVASGEKQGVKT